VDFDKFDREFTTGQSVIQCAHHYEANSLLRVFDVLMGISYRGLNFAQFVLITDGLRQVESNKHDWDKEEQDEDEVWSNHPDLPQTGASALRSLATRVQEMRSLLSPLREEAVRMINQESAVDNPSGVSFKPPEAISTVDGD